MIPEARGQASQITEAAIAYRDRITNEAQGQADRFSQVLESYLASPDVTRRRMYLETLQEVFSTHRQGDHRREHRGTGVIPYFAARPAQPEPQSAVYFRPEEAANEARHLRRRRPRHPGRDRDRGLSIDLHHQPDRAGPGAPLRPGRARGEGSRALLQAAADRQRRPFRQAHPRPRLAAARDHRFGPEAARGGCLGRYKIINPLLFYQSVGSIEVATRGFRRSSTPPSGKCSATRPLSSLSATSAPS